MARVWYLFDELWQYNHDGGAQRPRDGHVKGLLYRNTPGVWGVSAFAAEVAYS